MEEETEKCAQIIYEVWEENVNELLKKFRFKEAQARRGQVPSPKRLDIYFTPLITKKSYKWNKDEFGVKNSIEALMELYLEGNSPVWDSWEEYEEEYRKRRNWGNLRGEDIHTHFIPDEVIIEMLNRIGRETSYNRNDFNEFGKLYSLEKNQSSFYYDINEKDKEKVFYEVLIHEISHFVLKFFCKRHGHSYPSDIGEAIGWFLDHKLFEGNTYHTAADATVEDLDIGTFSGYSFSEEEKRYVVWLIDALNFSYELDKKNDKTGHPYPWAVSFISLIIKEDELIKKKIFTQLLPRKTKETIEDLEEVIETEYREEYEELVKTVEEPDKKIKELEQQVGRKDTSKRELYEKKRFYEVMKSLKYALESEIGLEDPEDFEKFIEKQVQESAEDDHSFEETVEKMEEKITSHVEKQKNKIEAALELCVEKEKEMKHNQIAQVEGEKIPERKNFIERLRELNRINEELENRLNNVEYRFHVFRETN